MLFIATSKPNRKRRRKTLQLGARRTGAANDGDSSSGLRIEGGKLRVVDWSEWMRKGPAIIHVCLQEGTESPEEVTANVLRRLFPGHAWPPAPEDPFYSTWRSMNALVGRALDQPTRPHFAVVGDD